MSTNKQQDPDWLNSLRALYKDALCYDWDSNVRKLNERYNLTGQRKLSLQVAKLPPAWFNGDVESIEPGRWVMAVSLNPHVAPEGYYGTQTGKTWWPYWLRFNIKHWYPRFFRPLVQVAAMGLGEQVSKEDASRFACERMVFLEVCPYTSGKFDLSTDTVRTLLEEDRGFSIAKQVRQLLLSEAKPALVLVNGNAAIGQFEEASGASLTWERVNYESESKQTKSLWHRQGHIDAGSRIVPIIGFPFLSTPSTHNSSVEIHQLGARIGDFIKNQA